MVADIELCEHGIIRSEQSCCEHTTDDWRTCQCHDCGIDRWIDEQERKCTCCERVECVCPTDACYRCATSEGVR